MQDSINDVPASVPDAEGAQTAPPPPQNLAQLWHRIGAMMAARDRAWQREIDQLQKAIDQKQTKQRFKPKRELPDPYPWWVFSVFLLMCIAMWWWHNPEAVWLYLKI